MKNTLTKLSTPLLFIFFLMLLNACEYDNDDMNYHELTPPPDNPEISVNLANVAEGKQIYVYAPTEFTYTVNISAGKLLYTRFYIDDKEIYSNNGRFYLDPQSYPDTNTAVLKVVIKLTSGTSSLAEFFGQEVYDEVTFTYPLKFVNPAFTIKLEQRVNANGFLEVFWSKPEIEGADVEKYEVYSSDGYEQILVETIKEPNKTHFEDRDYVYGEKFFRVVASVNAGGERYESEDYYKVKYTEIKEENLKFDLVEGGKLTLEVDNPNPYRCKYFVKYSDNISWQVTDANLIIFDKRPAFPMRNSLAAVPGYQNYIIGIAPAHITDVPENNTYSYFFASYEEIQLEPYYRSINDDRIFRKCFYDPSTKNLVFHNKSLKNDCDTEHLTVYNLNQNQIVDNFPITCLEGRTGFSFQNYVFMNTGNSRALVSSESFSGGSNRMYLFSSYKSQSPEYQFDFRNGESVVSFTTNNIVLTSSEENCNLYDCTTGTKLKTWAANNSETYQLSPNGLYMSRIDVSKNQYIYKINADLSFELIFQHIADDVYEMGFHPTKDEIAYITYGPPTALKSDLINLESKSVIKNFDYRIRCFDPQTDNICLHESHDSSYKFHVLSSDYNNLYTLDTNAFGAAFGLSLFDNFLIEDFNSILDITKAIKQ